MEQPEIDDGGGGETSGQATGLIRELTAPARRRTGVRSGEQINYSLLQISPPPLRLPPSSAHPPPSSVHGQHFEALTI
jgi:hypothetical protein